MGINQNVRDYVNSLPKEDRSRLLTVLLKRFKFQRGLFYLSLLFAFVFIVGVSDNIFEFNVVVLSTNLAFILLFSERMKITRKKIKDGYGLEV